MNATTINTTTTTASSSMCQNNKTGGNNLSRSFFFSKKRKWQRTVLSSSVVAVIILLLSFQAILHTAEAVLTTPVSPGSFATSTGRSIAIAMTAASPDGIQMPVIAYYHLPAQKLYYIRCGDVACTAGGNIVTLVDGGSSTNVGMDVSIAIVASSGFAVISYKDYVNSDLLYARCLNIDCTSRTLVRVDSAGSVGQYTSIAVHPTTAYPIISYYDFGNLKLKVAACSSVNCQTPTPSIVVADLASSVGRWSSLKLRSNGLPTIAYYNSVGKYLVILFCGTATCDSAPTSRAYTSMTDGGMYASLALDSQDRPIVSYYDAALSRLMLLRCNEFNCLGQYNTVVDSAGGRWTSVALKYNGFPIISYVDNANPSRLKIANCLNAQCSQSIITTPDTSNNIQVLTSIVTSPTTHSYAVAFASGGSLKVHTDTYDICPPNSVFLGGAFYDPNGWAYCECSTGYVSSNSGYRWASLSNGDTCTPVTCPTNSQFAGAYNNDGSNFGGNPICICNSGLKSTSGDRYLFPPPFSSESCTDACPTSSGFSSFFGYDSTHYPICVCGQGTTSTSGDRLAYLKSSETCSAIVCPSNSVFSSTYDNGGNGYPICSCNSGFRSTSGDRLAELRSSETCSTACSANSVFYNYDGNNYPVCQCNMGFKSTSGDRLASFGASEVCTAVACPSNSAFSSTYDNGGNGYPICSCNSGFRSTSGDRLAELRSSETCTTACSANSVFYNYDGNNYPVCQCNMGFKSTSGDRLASLDVSSEVCTAVTCPLNSIFSNTYDNEGIGYPICECNTGFRSNSGDRLVSLSSSETCTAVPCPLNSVFYGYDASSNYPICQCNAAYKSTSGDRLALLSTTSETCSTVTCPTASSFSDYDNTNGYPYCQCDPGYSGKTGVTTYGSTTINETGSCQWVCPTNSEEVTVNNSPACQCIEGYVDSVALKRPVSQTGICSTYTCPTYSVLSYDNMDGSPICTCITNYIGNTGSQTVSKDGTCTLVCPENSQLYNDGTNDYCKCNKGYYGDTISIRDVTPGTGVCTSKCGYKGASCTTTADCCKPDKKFICLQNKCSVCRKHGTICTRNTQCCSLRCNRKASICREPKN